MRQDCHQRQRRGKATGGTDKARRGRGAHRQSTYRALRRSGVLSGKTCACSRSQGCSRTLLAVSRCRMGPQKKKEKKGPKKVEPLQHADRRQTGTTAVPGAKPRPYVISAHKQTRNEVLGSSANPLPVLRGKGKVPVRYCLKEQVLHGGGRVRDRRRGQRGRPGRLRCRA